MHRASLQRIRAEGWTILAERSSLAPRRQQSLRASLEFRRRVRISRILAWLGPLVILASHCAAASSRVVSDDEIMQIIKKRCVTTLNGEAFSMETKKPMYTVHEGRRYRLKFRNASDDIHPLHLHRHSFELTRIAGKPAAGMMKDVVMLGGFQELEFDFVADNPGPTLFHCHQQLHMDFGFMALFNYA
jgi:hypothetical protein